MGFGVKSAKRYLLFSSGPDQPICPKPSFLCPDSAVCLTPSQLCDGKEDCPNGFDENLCVKSCPQKGKQSELLMVDMCLVYYLYLVEPLPAYRCLHVVEPELTADVLAGLTLMTFLF